ncbi:uncharacterized protein PHACADRAFT_248445 [Phanerochaete carnosa HHB-10118-sp]|uniref:Uncharacterized protein n=1 Tax=Phanerochaete carnosa (strain HHB-10118-sp) TaxID=650164 RepID=K5WQD0_PHACS|nr:uncharacterized protein PHACADRAFT_248445 [Phanerochaete carnosa HHB-10118-sp]EKM61685.1 hypothetical protein PHACADRAFT_248445 [Phanerochaete carnosa HHB-10118-sp]
MFAAKVIAVALVSVAIVNAAPAPGLFDDFTSDVDSVFDHATSAVGSAFDEATSVVDSALALATASSVYEDATKVIGTATSQVFATIVTANNVPVVEVTSVGGSAITLATGTASGFTTSFAGHTFTAASATGTSTSSSASASSTGKNAAVGGFEMGGALQLAAFLSSIVAGAAMVV